MSDQDDENEKMSCTQCSTEYQENVAYSWKPFFHDSAVDIDFNEIGYNTEHLKILFKHFEKKSWRPPTVRQNMSKGLID